MGYNNVYAYNEGYPAWVKRGYPFEKRIKYPSPDIPFVSADGLKGMIDNKENMVIVDLRDELDRGAGYIKGSLKISMVDLRERYQELPKNKKIILLDLYGKQTYIAARFLAFKGYTNIYRLDGGFVGGWIKAGYGIEK